MFFFGKILVTNIFFFIFGKIFQKYFLNEKTSLHQSETAIFGAVFLSFLALLLNFFFPLDKILNSIVIILSLFFIHSSLITKKDLQFVLISSILTFIIIAYSNINTPDAGLYHLPYTQILNENKLIVGLSNLHSRFGHISIIQYLSAINYNLVTNVEGILIPLASLMVFVFIYFINELNIFKKSNLNITIDKLFCLFIVCYISYKINRYSGFGNDAIAHLLLFYLISIFLKSDFNYKNIQKLSIIAVFVFLNKITLILAFLFPLINFLRCKEKKIKIFYSFSVVFLILWLAKNILVSGCLIYPIEKTCYNRLSWTNETELVKQKIAGEAWAKGWPDRTNKSISQKVFINEFNWIKAWSLIHLKYITKIILPYVIFLILLSIIINFKFKKFKNLKTNFSNERLKITSTIIILLLGNLIFFVKFPLYRYGYSYTISLVSIIFSLTIFSYNKKFLKKLFNYFIIISITILSLKQFIRIKDNYNIKSLWPNINFFSNNIKDKNELKIETIGENYKVYISEKECMYNKSPCTNIFNSKLSHKKVLNYNLIFVGEKF